MTQTEEFEFKTLESVWVSCPYPVLALGLEKMLEANTRVYSGPEPPPANEAPFCIIFCPGEEDIASAVRDLRALVPNAPLLVLGLHVDTQLARRSILAGAHCFIHIGIQQAQVAHALFAASKGETTMPRDLLEAFLEEMVSREDLVPTPCQQDFLELVAACGSFRDEIVLPRELLEAFLKEETAV
jgi:DNA-binding NarL/FixJ family response regulator